MTTPVTWCWRYREARSPLVAMCEEARRTHWDPGAICWQVQPGVLGPVERRLLSQALHASQARLLAGAELIGTLPAVDAKVYYGSEVADDARQLDVLGRYLRADGEVEPAHPELIGAVDQLLGERHWHRTLLVAHMMEQLVAVALRHARRVGDPLLDDLSARLLADHARHAAFVSLVLEPALRAADDGERLDLVAYVTDIGQALVDAVDDGDSGAAHELSYRLAGLPGRIGLSVG